MAKIKKIRFKKDSLPSGLNKDGSEICDSKPTELHSKMHAPVTLRQKMKSLWKDFQQREQEANEIETIQDAADFEVSNEDMLVSQYEHSGSLKHVLDYIDDDLKEAAAQAAKDGEAIEAEGGKQEGEINE
jgi:hypothetical protein